MSIFCLDKTEVEGGNFGVDFVFKIYGKESCRGQHILTSPSEPTAQGRSSFFKKIGLAWVLCLASPLFLLSLLGDCLQIYACEFDVLCIYCCNGAVEVYVCRCLLSE